MCGGKLYVHTGVLYTNTTHPFSSETFELKMLFSKSMQVLSGKILRI